jgi:hypothetical protein
LISLAAKATLNKVEIPTMSRHHDFQIICGGMCLGCAFGFLLAGTLLNSAGIVFLN